MTKARKPRVTKASLTVQAEDPAGVGPEEQFEEAPVVSAKAAKAPKPESKREQTKREALKAAAGVVQDGAEEGNVKIDVAAPAAEVGNEAEEKSASAIVAEAEAKEEQRTRNHDEGRPQPRLHSHPSRHSHRNDHQPRNDQQQGRNDQRHDQMGRQDRHDQRGDQQPRQDQRGDQQPRQDQRGDQQRFDQQRNEPRHEQFNKKVAPVRPPVDDLDEEDLEPQPGSRPPVNATGHLALKLSHALHEKLLRTAQDEGVSVEALAAELLAEGVVLRAWEIIERKGAMRGGNVGQPQGGGSNFRPGSNNQRHNNSNNRGGGRPQNNNNNRRGAPPNNNWMEDKAAFLEYVRNQEKRRR